MGVSRSFGDLLGSVTLIKTFEDNMKQYMQGNLSIVRLGL